LSLLRAEGACIALRADDYMHIVAAVGEADVLAGVHLPVATSLLGRAVTTGELVISNDFEVDPASSNAVRRLANIDRALIAPLVTARGTVGAIAVLNREDSFTLDDARVLKRLSDQVSVAIVNARLFEEVERATSEWKVAFDAIPSGMVVLDDRGIVQRCNARAADLTRLDSIAELLGKPFSVALLGLDSGDSGIDTLVRGGRSDESTVRATLRDDERGRLFDLTVAPHPAGGSVITFEDVTEVHGLAERHRRVLEMASEAIIITDTSRRVAYANPAAHTLFMREDLIGAPTIELIPAEAHRRLVDAETAAMSGLVQRYELPVLRADGEVRQVSISSAPLLETGQITGTVACLRDVTDRRQ
jgi:PAS domain S-box-containing protein